MGSPDLEGRVFVRRGQTLVPADQAADEMLQALPEGREVVVTVRRARSPQFQRWVFALLRSVMRNHPTLWRNEAELLRDLKDAVGHVYPPGINPLTGALRRPTRSINLASMSADAFKRWKNRCVYVLDSQGFIPSTEESYGSSRSND